MNSSSTRSTLLCTFGLIFFTISPLHSEEPYPKSLELAEARRTTIGDFNQRHFPRRIILDLLSNFWSGTPLDGNIVPTWNGFQNGQCLRTVCPHNGALPDRRGSIWEAGTLYNVLYNYYELLDERRNFDRLSNSLPDFGLWSEDRQEADEITQRLNAEWRHLRTSFDMTEMVWCGKISIIGINGLPEANQIVAADDAGWDARLYLQAYRVTHDETALSYAEALVQCSLRRWQDVDGGIWYTDGSAVRDPRGREKSLLQVALDLDSLDIYEITHQSQYLQSVMASLHWIETHLSVDELFWIDYWTSCNTCINGLTPDGPNAIRVGNSQSDIAGNMAMAVLYMRLFRITGNDMYRQKALHVSIALLRRETFADGVFMDDRDAWTDGTFVGEWVRETVLVNPELWTAARNVRRTAHSIVQFDRDPQGRYGGDWTGPYEVDRSIWGRGGSVPDQIMTSSSAANMALAAAFLPNGPIMLRMRPLNPDPWGVGQN